MGGKWGGTGEERGVTCLCVEKSLADKRQNTRRKNPSEKTPAGA